MHGCREEDQNVSLLSASVRSVCVTLLMCMGSILRGSVLRPHALLVSPAHSSGH